MFEVGLAHARREGVELDRHVQVLARGDGGLARLVTTE